MRKFLGLAFALIMGNPAFASEEYISFDNFQNSINFTMSHHAQNPPSTTITLGSYSLVRVNRSFLANVCQGDSICRVDIGILYSTPFAALYIDVEGVPMKILRYQLLNPSKQVYKIDVNEVNNYVTISPN